MEIFFRQFLSHYLFDLDRKLRQAEPHEDLNSQNNSQMRCSGAAALPSLRCNAGHLLPFTQYLIPNTFSYSTSNRTTVNWSGNGAFVIVSISGIGGAIWPSGTISTRKSISTAL